MGPLGWQETVLILIVALVVFGPKKLPELGKTLGKAMTEFRRASSELRGTWSREMAAIERESESVKRATRQVSNEISSSLQSHVDDPEDPYAYEQEHGTAPPKAASTSAAAEDSAKEDAAGTNGATAPATENSEAAKAPEGAVPTTSETASDETAGKSQPPESKAVTT